MSFKKYIEEYPNNKFSIIVGSGFHLNIIKEYNPLTCWKCLLSSLPNSRLISSNNLLAFEEIIQENTKIQGEKNCDKIEKNLLKNISTKISQLQTFYINQKFEEYSNVVSLINPNFISDVISLNFDTTIETIFRKIHNIKRTRLVSGVKPSIKKYGHTFVYFEYKIENNIIRFWYPHGSIDKPTSLILSNRSYSNYLSVIENVRKKYKEIENQSKQNEIGKESLTWISQIINNPILIIGAGLSYEELDLWSLLIIRERNFSKIQNNRCRKPIYQMTIEKINNVWIERLFENINNYDAQWGELIKILNQSKN